MIDPNESSHFAFQDLVQLARADRGVNGPEREVLDRFARHLGIAPEKARRYYRVCRKRARSFPQDPQRQLDLLKMLARVAYSDGVMHEDEGEFFQRLGEDFDIPRTRLAHVLQEAEERSRRHRHLDRRWWCGLALGGALVGVLWWMQATKRPDEMTGFKTLDAETRPALLLVYTRYTMRHATLRPRTFAATGTGFFVSSDGLFLTNKHVVQPWRFIGKGIDLLAKGYVLVPESVETRAWREGARVLDERREPIANTGYSTTAGSLRLVGLAPDAELPVRERPAHLRDAALFCHASDNGDLALLRCAVEDAVTAVELAEQSDDVRRLDPVLVLGYPRGLRLLETANAVSSPTVGRVRKVEDTIYVTTPVVGGNSGGPLLDRHGRVIGIATRTSGDATMACCLRIEHGRALINSGR